MFEILKNWLMFNTKKNLIINLARGSRTFYFVYWDVLSWTIYSNVE